MGGAVSTVTKAVQVVSKTPAFKFFKNPLVQLGATLFLSWALRPKTPDIPDFATNTFDDFEKGILLNSSNALIADPIVLYKGNIENFSVQESDTSSNVVLSIVSQWADFDKKNGRKTNNTSQQRFFSTDVGMDFSSETIRDIKWGKA